MLKIFCLKTRERASPVMTKGTNHMVTNETTENNQFFLLKNKPAQAGLFLNSHREVIFLRRYGVISPN